MGVQEQTDRKRSVKKRATKHEAPGVSTDTTCDVLREIIAFQQTQVSRDIPSVCGNLRDSKAGIECAPMLQDNELGQSQQGDPQQFLCTSQVEADSHLAVLGLRAGLPQRKSITENSGCRGHQRGHQRQPLRALTPGEGVAQPEARGHSRAFWAGPGAAGRGSDGHTLACPQSASACSRLWKQSGLLGHQSHSPEAPLRLLGTHLVLDSLPAKACRPRACPQGRSQCSTAALALGAPHRPALLGFAIGVPRQVPREDSAPRSLPPPGLRPGVCQPACSPTATPSCYPPVFAGSVVTLDPPRTIWVFPGCLTLFGSSRTSHPRLVFLWLSAH